MSDLSASTTPRGFSIIEFVDNNGVECSIQKSSLATQECIWLGASAINLKHFKAGQGWKDIPLPFSIEEHYVATNRMHLSREHVRALLPILQHFADTGELPGDG